MNDDETTARYAPTTMTVKVRYSLHVQFSAPGMSPTMWDTLMLAMHVTVCVPAGMSTCARRGLPVTGATAAPSIVHEYSVVVAWSIS